MAEIIQLLDKANASGGPDEWKTISQPTTKLSLECNFNNQGGAVNSLKIFIYGSLTRKDKKFLFGIYELTPDDLVNKAAMFHLADERGAPHFKAEIELDDTGDTKIDLFLAPIFV